MIAALVEQEKTGKRTEVKRISNLKPGDTVVDRETSKIYMIIDIIEDRDLAKVDSGKIEQSIPIDRLETLSSDSI